MRIFKYKLVVALSLILSLVMGPVSAQTMYRCDMMGDVPRASCCCDDPLRADEWNGTDVALASGGCCEVSLELSADTDTDLPSAASTRLEVRSDIDPPTVGVVASQTPTLNAELSSHAGLLADTHLLFAGNQIYLTTQRLRI